MMKFAIWLKQVKMSRVEAARQLALSPGHVTDLCKDRSYPTLPILLKIIDFTDGEVSANDFLPQAAAKKVEKARAGK